MDVETNRFPYVLGIDLGARSVGWAVVRLDGDEPVAVERAGVRCFEAGVEGDIEQGKDSSRAAARRQARSARRLLWRRGYRLGQVFRCLQRHGLLPGPPAHGPIERDTIIKQLDAELRTKHLGGAAHVEHQVLPYRLRTMALDRKLEPHELGRALYHLAQRRGFLSNRKADRKDKELGEVKQAISELAAAMTAAQCRTLGEYLARLNPDEQRIRRRWTARWMYEREFEAIFKAQRALGAQLPDEFEKELRWKIFRQRPLKSQRWLVGKCPLEDGRKRAAMALPIAQRFRMLQGVNNLRITEPTGVQRPLSGEERRRLIDALESEGDRTFDQIRRLLGLTKSRTLNGQRIIGHTFNLEEGGEKRLCGNRTAAALRPIFGQRWDAMTTAQQERIVFDILEYRDSEALVRRGIERWALDEAHARLLGEHDATLEAGYARYSRPALLRLVAAMEAGIDVETAIRQEYPQRRAATEPLELLPPVLKSLPDLRNPAVCRSLTELRKVVNALVRHYGKPQLIRVELARELKQPRAVREKQWKRNRERQGEREAAIAAIKAKCAIANPTGDDIEKWLLAEECAWLCPYTGRGISAANLDQFDVEHIIPMSRSLENGFVNKTLCYHEENRDRKRNRTPYEAYGGDEQRWHEILGRVRRFNGPLRDSKLARFQMAQVPEDFAERHLNDTRYASRLAAEYLGLLYGGVNDAEGRKRIQVNSGPVTAYLRDEWGLNAILGDGGGKSRDDHRHHAVDAIAIALAGPKAVKLLSDAAGRADAEGRRRFARMPAPRWLMDTARTAVRTIVVSHRAERKVGGKLHDDTNYSRPHKDHSGSERRHVRKRLDGMTREEVERIVDERIRALVLERLGDGDPKKVFADENRLPRLRAHDGREIPIRKARIAKPIRVLELGRGAARRYAAPGSNHHVVIYSVLDEKGQEVWRCWMEPVTRFEAVRRLAEGLPVVRKDVGEGRRFLFALSPGDTVCMTREGNRGYYRVCSISSGEMECRAVTDARPAGVLRKLKGARVRVHARDLLAGDVRKVEVDAIGNVRRSG